MFKLILIHLPSVRWFWSTVSQDQLLEDLLDFMELLKSRSTKSLLSMYRICLSKWINHERGVKEFPKYYHRDHQQQVENMGHHSDITKNGTSLQKLCEYSRCDAVNPCRQVISSVHFYIIFVCFVSTKVYPVNYCKEEETTDHLLIHCSPRRNLGLDF